MLHCRQEGVVRYAIESIDCIACDDAGVAGCFETQISTTGGHLRIEGHNTHGQLHVLARIQYSTVTSTPDAELIAASTCVRTSIILAMCLCDIILKRLGVNVTLG